MNNNNLVLVVKREALLENNEMFQGFKSVESAPNYLCNILSKAIFVNHHDVKGDLNYKEILAYGVIANFEDNRFFVYKKFCSADNVPRDPALKDVWSWGISENVFQKDLSTGYSSGSKVLDPNVPLYMGMLNKTFNNVLVPGQIATPQILGFLNNDAGALGACKLGVAYIIPTTTKGAHLNPATVSNSSGIQKGYMARFAFLESKLNDSDVIVEPWSKSIVDPLRKIYNQDIPPKTE